MKLIQLLEEGIHEYGCAMIPIPEPIRSSILTWSKENISQDLLYEEEGGLENDPHITALYGIHGENPDNVQQILFKVNPFPVTLGAISKFSADTHDVLKLNVHSRGIIDLNNKLKMLPHTNKYTDYIPHCTLAYVNKGSCDHLLDLIPIQNSTFIASKVEFSSPDDKKTMLTISENALQR